MTDSDSKPIKRVVETVYPSQMGLSGATVNKRALREAKQDDPSLYDDIAAYALAAPKPITEKPLTEKETYILLAKKSELDKLSYKTPTLEITAAQQVGTPIISKDDLAKSLRKTLAREVTRPSRQTTRLSKDTDIVSVSPSDLGLGRRNKPDSSRQR